MTKQPCIACRSVAIERNELVKLRKDFKDKTEAVKRLNEEINELTKKASIQEVQLNAIREERDNARQTLESQGLPKDEIVKRAFELRDQAVARKNTVEIELAKTRIEVMHINSQLMESVQQKVELSQQLEQWQVSCFGHLSSLKSINSLHNNHSCLMNFFALFDTHSHLITYHQVDMQELLDEQLKRKLHEEGKKRLSGLSSSNPPIQSTANLLSKTRLATNELMNKSKLLKLWR